MGRVVSFLTLWAFIASALVVGCGGSESTSSTRSKNVIRFEHQWLFMEGRTELRITIDACNQSFELEPRETQTVECVPEDDSERFLVVIEGQVVGVSYTGGEAVRKEFMVSGGQTVTIKGTLSTFEVYVDGVRVE